MTHRNRRTRVYRRGAGIALAGLALWWAGGSAGAPVVVYGGPGFDAVTGTGYYGEAQGAIGVNDGGVVVSEQQKWDDGNVLGVRAVRWGVGTAAVELTPLGTNPSATTVTHGQFVSTSGGVVGTATAYVNGVGKGTRPVRWEGATPVELELPGPPPGTTRSVKIKGANAAGTAAGIDGAGHVYRWDGSGTTAATLDNGGISAEATAISKGGTVVGLAFVPGAVNGTYVKRAVRWDAGGTAIAWLADPVTPAGFVRNTSAVAINAAGTVVGGTEAHDAISGASVGPRVVRWSTAGAVEQLGDLGTSAGGSFITAFGISDDGTIAGNATKYVNGEYRGYRAVRWAPGGTAATELGNLGDDASGMNGTTATAINAGGVIAGYADRYVNGALTSSWAVVWGADGVAVDLNTLIDPSSGWFLREAHGISDTGYVVGDATFDPDGAGPMEPYERTFELQLPASIPEPAGVGIGVVLGAVGVLRRRRGGGG